jgi:putative ABC transport system substrate-binding protein
VSLAGLAAEAVRRKADVIVAFGTSATQASMKATSSVPIVFVVGTDPVELGFVSNLARPEANLTGLATLTQLLVAKRLELLKELVPTLREVAVLWNPASSGQAASLKIVMQAAGRIGAIVQPIEIGSTADLQIASAALSKSKPDALIAVPSTSFLEMAAAIVALAAELRLPAVFAHADFVTAGGLMSYSPDLKGQFRRAAVYVDRILKGAKPADLPVEQPTKFELAINLRTARQLGITIPRTVLIRAEIVID